MSSPQTRSSTEQFPIATESLEKPPVEYRTDAPQSLIHRHHQYKNYNQWEPETVDLYIENDHPKRFEYKRFRLFFEQLLWAANSNARFYSYKSEHENVEYWGPKIHVTGLGYSSAPCNPERHRKAVNQMDLTTENTIFGMGAWSITTQNQEFWENFKATAADLDLSPSCIHVMQDHPICRPSWERSKHYSIMVTPNSINTFNQLKSIIDDYADPITSPKLPDKNGPE